MALLLIPFFMPLLLIGWVVAWREDREQQLLEQQVANTWGVLFGRESLVTSREQLFDEDGEHASSRSW
jgi:hypothetical protein